MAHIASGTENCNVLAISKYLFDQVCLVNLKMAGHCSWILKSFGSGLHKALANSTHLECSKIITQKRWTIHLALEIPPVWPFNVTGQLPSSADQIFSRKSAPPLRTTFPDGKNLQVFMSEMWPWRSCCKQHKHHHLNMWSVKTQI